MTSLWNRAAPLPRGGQLGLGIAVTSASVIVTPLFSIAKRRLSVRLGSAATAGEGTQNILCAYLGAAVLSGSA